MGRNAQQNWDDLRYVLAVADSGSVANAARGLGVNHATVLRRIAAFETGHGLRIFEKTPTGYQVSPGRRALIEALREAGDAVSQVERLIQSERPSSVSRLRITSTDAFCHGFLPPILSKLSVELGQSVSILAGNSHLDFGRLQADITVRPAVKLPDDMDGTHAASLRFFAYESAKGATDWLGLEGVLAHTVAAEWLRGRANGADPALATDSFVMLAGLAALGRGRALLPAFLGDGWPGLSRTDVTVDLPPLPVWVASHVDLMHSGRLRRARKFLTEAIAAREPQLTGRA